jgi:hypothetical protein
MAASAVQLCARALVKLGARPIASFDEDTMESQVCATLYPGLRDALLSAHPWSFATAQARLARLATQPVADFANAFQLPANFLRALSVGSGTRGRGAEYRIAERRLHCDLEAPILTYVFRPAESEFPAFFDHTLVARLAAEFCLPLTESTSRAEALVKFAETELVRAKQIDAQQDAMPRIEDFALTEARLS